VHEFLGESNQLPVFVQDEVVRAAAGFDLGRAALPDGAAKIFIRPHHVIAVPAPHGDWEVTRIAATGAQARISLSRGTVTLEAAMTADGLLEAGLLQGGRADVTFTGGTLFAAAGTRPVRLVVGREAVASPV
jgi:ABC-type sulfate/molybdate transport systems ATPase subunit